MWKSLRFTVVSDNREFPYISLTQCPLLITSYIIEVHLLQLRNHYWHITIIRLHTLSGFPQN